MIDLINFVFAGSMIFKFTMVPKSECTTKLSTFNGNKTILGGRVRVQIENKEETFNGWEGELRESLYYIYVQITRNRARREQKRERRRT